MEEKIIIARTHNKRHVKNIWFSGFENDNPFRIMIKKYLRRLVGSIPLFAIEYE